MAKTASQIQAERKAIDDARNAIHERQMAEIEDKKTQSTDPAKKVAMIQEIVSEKSAPKTALDMQKKKEDAAEQKKEPDVPEVPKEPDSQTKAEEAKKKLEEYRNSEEKKKNAEKRLQDKYAQQLLYGITDSSEVLYDEDPIEKELQAEADYWDNKVKQEADEKLFAANMQEIQNLSGAERTAFDNYANNRTFVDPENLEAYKRLKERYGDKLNDLKYTYQRDKEEKAAREMAEKTAAKMDQGGALADTGRNVLSIGANLVGGITGTAGRINEMVNGTGPYQTAAKYTYGDVPSVYGKTVRDKTSEQILAGQDLNISDGISGRELGAIAYQGGMGALDTGARLLASGGNPFIAASMAASQTFSSTVQEATEKGATPQEAYALATVSAGIEALTEKLPLDNLVSIAKGGANPKLIVNLLLQAGVEIGEEEASLIGTTLAEMAILKEKSGYQQSIQKAAAMGVPYEQAVAEADRALLEEAKQTALISGFSGLLSAGGAEGRNRLLGGSQSQQDSAQQPAAVQQEQTPAQTEQAAQPAQPVQEGQEQTRTVQEERKIPVRLYRGYNQSDNPTERNLTRKKSIYDFLGKEDKDSIQNLLPLAYFTESEEDAKGYADMDVSNLDLYKATAKMEYRDRIMRGKDVGGLTEEEYINKKAEESFRTLHGREPNKAGRVESYSYTPKKPLDITEIGDITDAGKAYKALAEKLGMSESELDNILLLENSLEPEFRAFQLLRNTPRDDLGSRMLDLVRSAGYDSVRYNEDGNNHYAILTDRDGWDNGLVVDSAEDSLQRVTDTVTETITGKTTAAPQTSTQQVDTFGQSTEGGQVKGTGAAERNFSGVAAYEGMLEDGNIQKSRPGAVRDVEMPKKDFDGRRVTEFAGNAVSAGVTPDPMADAIKSLVGDKKLSFDTRTNQQSLDNAAEAIKAQGDDTVISSLHTNAENKTIVDGDIEKGLILYAQYANNPDPEAQKTASQIILDMGTIANMSGRNLQLFSLMKRMTPEGQLMTVRKNIERSIADINKGRSGSKQITYVPGQGNLDTAKNIAQKRNVVIDDALEQNFLEAKTDEQKKAALDDIYRNVATQIKPTLGEAWDAWRNLAMLGNIKTHERNFASTGAFKPYTTIKRTIGAALESVFVKQENRTKSMLGISKDSRDLVAWAKGDARTEDVKKLLGGAGTTGDEARSTIQDYRKILPGPLDTARKKNLELMEAEDFFFKRSEYALSLASFLKARGYSIKQVQDGLVPRGVLDAGRQYAIKEAQKATFNDRNKLSDTLSKLNQAADEKGGPVYHIISKGIVPFLKTPANVVARVVEYNPVSLGKTLLTAKSDIDSGRKSGAEVIDEISAGLTGSAAMVLGAALANGLIPGVELVGAIEDEDELREGAQEYSIRIGDKYYSVAWLAPAMIPLFIGANLHSKFSKMDDTVDGWDAVQAFAEATAGSLNPMLELSMLSSLSDIVDKVKYEETPGDMLMTGLLNAATSYFTQGIPTVFGQLEQAAETEKKSTYVNTDNKVERMVKTAVSGATKRLPGDAYQTTKLDEFGEPVKKDEHWAKRTFDAFINPFTTSERKADAITKEITRLNKAQTKNVTPPTAAKTISYTDKQGNAHKDVRLTEEQYQTMAQTQGETAKSILDSLISSKDYAAMTDAQKAEAIQTAYNYARKTAEIAAIGDNHTGYEDSWMMEMEHGKEADYIIRRVTKSGLTGATDALKTAWEKDYDQTGRSDDLKWAYDTFKALTPEAREEVAGQITGTTAKYIEAREKGIGHEEFVRAAETISRWEGTGSNGTVRDIDRRQAIANTRGLTDDQIDTIMKVYMDDYDPENGKTEKTELKYDYIRQELGLTPKQYAMTYRAYLDKSKKGEQIKSIMKMGYNETTATKLWEVYKGRTDVVSWYEMQ